MMKAANDLTSLKIEMNNIKLSYEYLKIINVMIIVLFIIFLPFGIVNAWPIDSNFTLYIVFWMGFLTSNLLLKHRFLWPRCKGYMKVHDVAHSKRILFWDIISMILIMSLVFGTSAFLFEGFEPIWFWEMLLFGLFFASFLIGFFNPLFFSFKKKGAMEEREKIFIIFIGMTREMARREQKVSEKKTRMDELEGHLDISSVKLPWRIKLATPKRNTINSSGLGEGYTRSKFIRRLDTIKNAKVKEARIKEIERFIVVEIEYFRFRSLEDMAKKLFSDLKEVLGYLKELEMAYDEAIRRVSQPVFAELVPVREETS
jgi:hypothetical protein